jgi:hypothetical protein
LELKWKQTNIELEDIEAKEKSLWREYILRTTMDAAEKNQAEATNSNLGKMHYLLRRTWDGVMVKPSRGGIGEPGGETFLQGPG